MEGIGKLLSRVRREVGYSLLPSQVTFHRSMARFKGFSGPVGSGKSHALCQEAIKLSYLNPGRTGVIGAPTYPMLRDATMTTFFELCERSKVPYTLNKATNTVTPELCTDSLCECGCVRSGLTAVVRWELGNWSFGFSVPGFPSRPESASAKPIAAPKWRVSSTLRPVHKILCIAHSQALRSTPSRLPAASRRRESASCRGSCQGVDAPILLGCETVTAGPCLTALWELCCFRLVTIWVTSFRLAGEAGIFASLPFYPMFSGVPQWSLAAQPSSGAPRNA